MKLPLLAGVYVRENTTNYDIPVGGVDIPVVNWFGPFADVVGATRWISQTTGNSPKEGAYEIHDFS